MNEKFVAFEEIEKNLKKNKFRLVFSILFFLFCFIFGILFMLFSPSFYPESELIGPLSLYVSIIIMLIGLLILYTVGLNSRRIIFYYNRIASLNFNHISLNSKHIMSKKDRIYIMYSGFANGIYFIDLNTTGGQSLIYRKPKKLPQFFIRLNKKITLEGFTFRVGEFSGFFKIPLNEDEYAIGDAKVLFMPLATFSKSQGSTDKIQMMADYVNGKTF